MERRSSVGDGTTNVLRCICFQNTDKSIIPEDWKEAQSDFFESFKAYDEAGSMQRIQVLNYLVLTTMLMGSDINPFDSPETKAYQNHPEISAMTDMVDAYQRNDIDKYENILQKNPNVINDHFIAQNIEEVTRSIRTNAVLKIVAPYSRFSFDFIAKKLRINRPEVQDIIGFLILDGRLNARIDQTTGIVEIKQGRDADRLQVVDQWSSAIASLWGTVIKSSEINRPDDGGQFSALPGLDTGSSGGHPAKGANGPAATKSPKKQRQQMRKLYQGQ